MTSRNRQCFWSGRSASDSHLALHGSGTDAQGGSSRAAVAKSLALHEVVVADRAAHERPGSFKASEVFGGIGGC